MNKEKIRVLLVDDHVMLRKGMAMLLGSEDDVEIIGEAGDGKEAIEQVRALKPDIMIMDISMPKLNGIEATRQILAESPHSKIIALSIHSAKSFVDDMLGAGASGYLLKESVPEELIQGIRAVMHGDMYLSSAITGKVVSAYLDDLSGEQADEISHADISILRTKLQKPQLIPNLVTRTHLFERLQTLRTRPLTLVSAPAGYGKSTLVRCWLERSDWPSAWLSLEPGDNDLRQFLNYFIAALDELFPDTCKNSLKLCNARQPSSLSAITASLSNELEALEEPFILVLDDYQHIDAQSSINELLQQLLRLPPLPLHLMILTRRDPPLNLVTLRAKNQLTEIRMQDLNFTLPEVKTLLLKTVKINAADEEIINLNNKMEGWVLGLRLVALSLRYLKDPNKFLKNLQGGIQYTQEYLVQEVISHQSPQMTDWLLKTSILDRFCPSLCDALCAPEYNNRTDLEDDRLNGSVFVNELIDNNLFVIRQTSQENQLRYQHFFRQLLQHELEKHLSPDEIVTLHLRASSWFEAEGLIDEAIHYALAADDIEGAAELVERHARFVMSETGQWQQVINWLSLLPEEDILSRPELLWARAWSFYYASNSSAIPAVLDQIEKIMGSHANAHDLSADIAVLRGYCAFLENHSTLALESVNSALALTEPPGTDTLPCRILAEFLFALLKQMKGHKEAASLQISEWLYDSKPLSPARAENLLQALLCMSTIAADPSCLGPLLYNQLAVSRSSRSTGLEARNNYLQGLYHLQQGEFEMAIPLLENAKNSEFRHHFREVLDGMCALALAYQIQGQPKKAAKTRQALFRFNQNNLSRLEPLANACGARLALMQHRPEDAIRWLKRSPPPHSEVMIFWFEIPGITYCHALLAEGSSASLKKAYQQLHEYAEINVEHHNNYQLIRILALQALVCDQLKKKKESFKVLEQAFTLAQVGGFIFTFLELGDTMNALLKRYTAQKAGQSSDQSAPLDFVHLLIEKFSAHQTQPLENTGTNPEPEPAWSGEPLTNRELDILTLLAQRLQNKEIAAKLFVSNETVKTHLKNLYQKLNVHNRREATAKASGIINSNIKNQP